MKVYKGSCASPGLVLGQVSRLEHHVETTTVGPFKPSRELQLLTDAIRTAQDELESMADRAAPSEQAIFQFQSMMQAGEVGAGDAHAFQIDAHQFIRAHAFGKTGGHVVAVAAIQKLDPVDLPRTQRREAGSGGHQVVLDLSCRDLVQRQLPGL